MHKVHEFFFEMMTNKNLNQGGNGSDRAQRNPPACVCSVCVRLSVRASRLTLASALHQRPSIIEQKLCDAQGNEIVYFYHSTTPHCQHKLPLCTAIHRRVPFFPGATLESEGKQTEPVQVAHKLGETGEAGRGLSGNKSTLVTEKAFSICVVVKEEEEETGSGPQRRRLTE